MNFLDDHVLYFINDKLTNPRRERMMRIITRLGDFCFIWIAYVIVAFLRGDRKLAISLIGVMLVINAINNGFIKAIFRRNRPFEDHPDIHITIPNPYGSSFPSGHSANAFGCAIIIMHFYTQYGFLALIFASLIAFSRMFLRVHYFTDVVFGSLVGTLIAIAYISIIIL
ncbi:hypothetical protein A4S06_01670 [Erysipelotrichaceae bacterium MTC7]|nr:hypothetical protein A4S06_01670 [Erysipelotrichaceae bacterium MTC7]